MLGRYLEEVVVGFGLCPWAEGTLRAGRFRSLVCVEAAPSAVAVLSFLDQCGERSARGGVTQVDIGFVTFPRVEMSWGGFDRWVEGLRRAEAARRPAGGRPEFFMATFHPGGPDALADRRDLTAFVRRTPDPTIQLVRADLLDGDKVGVGVSDQIGARSLATLTTGDAASRFNDVVRDIHADRARTYAGLLR